VSRKKEARSASTSCQRWHSIRVVSLTVTDKDEQALKEARARGYEANFVSCTIGFPGFWGQIRPVVPAVQLYGCYFAHFVPWWSDDIPYINSLKEAISKYRPGETEELVAGTGPVSAWGLAMFMADAIRRAAEKADAGNKVDGVTLRDALAETNMTVEGFDYPWRFSQQHPLLMPYMKMLEWSVGESTWKFISAPFLPRSLAG